MKNQYTHDINFILKLETSGKIDAKLANELLSVTEIKVLKETKQTKKEVRI